MAVSDWSTDPSQNTSVGPINIAEGCPAGNLNGAVREVMAEIKAFSENLGAQPASPNLTALAALPFVAGHIFLMTGSSAVEGRHVEEFGLQLIDKPDAISVANAIGAVRVAAISLGNPGYVRFQVGFNQFIQLAWGTASIPTVGANILYPANFPTMGFPVISGGVGGGGTQVNYPYVNAAAIALNGFAVINPRSETIPISWFAVGY